MRSIIFICAVCLAYACGEDSDPSQNNLAGSEAGNEAGAAGQGGAEGGNEAGAAGQGGGEAGNQAGTPGQGGGEAGNEAGTPGQGGGEAGAAGQGGEEPFGVCPEEVSFVGQVVGAGAEVPDGGTAVFEPWPADYQTGLAEVIAAVPAEGGGDDLVLETPIAVTEVTVIATDYKGNFDVSRSRTHFWVGDADGAIELYLDYMDPEAVPPFEIQVGQKISFNVTKVNRYFDKGQIVGVSDVVLVSDNAPVYLWTPDRALVVEDIHRVVRITGNLAGTGGECGAGNRCWDLDYGFGRAIFRSNSDFLQTGACVTFVGPLSFYQGEPQLNVGNFDWMRIY